MPMPTPSMSTAPRRRIVVGLDGSVRAYGWAILEVVGHRPLVLHAGCVVTETVESDRYVADVDGERLDAIATGILAVLDDALALSANVVAVIEAPAGSQSAASVKALASAYGLSRAVCTAKRVARRTVQAGAVKALLTGDRQADKHLLVKPVRALTGWSSTSTGKSKAETVVREAETDAVAVALTGIDQMGVLGSRGGVEQIAPGPPREQGRPLMSAETGSVRAPRGLSTGGLGPLVPSAQLSADDVLGGEEETSRI